MQKITCLNCGNDSSILEVTCPHCNEHFVSVPNVRIARLKEQTEALHKRYEEAVEKCKATGRTSSVALLESRVQLKSHAVMTMGYAELRYVIDNERKVFSTFYQRVNQGLQIPTGGKWDVLRGVTEHRLFQHQKEHIHFAALSLNHFGLTNYGECHVTLKEQMIKDRTSAFEGNNVTFTVYDQHATMADAIFLPVGSMSDWGDRHKLAVAKLGKSLPISSPTDDELARILVVQGATTADDDFVELHIWGPMTVRTVEMVAIQQKKDGRKRTPKKAELQSLRDILGRYGVPLVEV